MAAAPSRTVLVTGASGLLGRAVLAAFRSAPEFSAGAVGTAFSRASATSGLVRCDLRDEAAVVALIRETRPALVVHAAAERRPDVCEKDEAAASQLNIHATYTLARAAAAAGAEFVFVSTDYLFDGTSAPYDERAEACPLNAYGHFKLRGEYAALAAHARPVLLRVPVLFGPTTDLAESAVTTYAVAARDAARPQQIDDWQIRVPTFTPDVGATLVNVAHAVLAPGGPPPALRGVLNYSSSERFTRWSLVQFFGRLLNVDVAHISRLEGQPPGAQRPFDCKLDCGKIEGLGLAAPHTPFEAACRVVLGLPPVQA